MHPSPRVVAIPLYDPVYYDDGKAERPHGRLEGGQLPGLLRRAASGEQRLRSHHADLRAHARAPERACADRSLPEGHSSGGVAPHGSTRGPRRHARRRIPTADRPAAARGRRARRRARRPRRRASRHRPTWSSSTSAATPPSGDGGHRAAAGRPRRRRHLRRRAGGRSRPDPPVDARRRQRVLHLAAARGHVPRRGAPHRGAPRDRARRAKPPATTLVFFGAKGGAGTTTVAVNCGVELARLSKRPTVIVDLKPGLGEVALFLGVRPRYSCSTRSTTCTGSIASSCASWCAKHKSGLEILAGSDQFDRPGAAGRRRDRGAVPRCWRGSTTTSSSTPAARSTRAAVAALYTADTIFLVANPDVPSVRNAQRLLDRVRQLGACGERVRVLLNRAPEPYPIPPKQIETRARPPDSPHVPERLQDGVDRAQLRRAAGADAATPRSRRSSTASRARSLDPARPATKRRSRRSAAALGVSSALRPSGKRP